METEAPTATQRSDPRDLLSEWANASDEWVRYIVRVVLTGGGPLGPDEEAHAYALFRQEKALDTRELPVEDPLATLDPEDEAIEPLELTSLSDVKGVNALVEGGVIEPHEGLTILFGENGTGKTGYSRIFKALAASRTADAILNNIEVTKPEPQSATIGYKLGGELKTYAWTGQQGVAPFTRISIFDSPSVSFHVDDDLEYVYVPAALALFNQVIEGIKAVQAQVEAAARNLRAGSAGILSRFPRGASVYPLIETLGAATDLDELRAAADSDPTVEGRISGLRRTVAALEANTITAELKVQQRVERILQLSHEAASVVAQFNIAAHNRWLDTLDALRKDYREFRKALFEAADLPAEPDETWSDFIEAGENYRGHLSALGAHDAERCLYCRQPLSEAATSLIVKYAEYLEDKISAEISNGETNLRSLLAPVSAVQIGDVGTFVSEFEDTDDKPPFYPQLTHLVVAHSTLIESIRAGARVEEGVTEALAGELPALKVEWYATTERVSELRGQLATRAETLIAKRKELVELEAAAELTKSWPVIEAHVQKAKEADRLILLARPMPTLLRTVTGLAKTASDQMINESFDTLFIEECAALRAPSLEVEFVGRQGRAQRRKVLTGKHKPSKVLSEGEQKVLAIADFLAEARLAGITAPVIFDDPVSSLDHRRNAEVAQRVASLAETTQVIVFTHDILFATTLLGLMEATRRCSYFQITDEDGKGQITRATGPRWDSLNNIKKNINETIQAAKNQQGDARAALVRTGYDWVRSWCEVFTELDLLQGVTQRYQPNVRMASLPNIKTKALLPAIDVVNRIFEEACRNTDAHSQPLASLGVSPTLAGLEAHWAELLQARTEFLSAEE